MSLFNLEDVSLSFNEIDVLKNINLKIDNVGFNLILGKSGSGKSTLLNILYGILKPTKGKVYFNKKNISKLKDSFYANYHSYDCSLVFQHYNLFEQLSALENVILPLLIRGEKRSEAIKKGKALFNEFNLEYIQDQLVKTLSGGEKQRVAILRSLIISPRVILSDEPTGALDKENSKLVMEMFKKISKDICVIVVSHDEDLSCPYADRIIRLKDGQIDSDDIVNKLSYKGDKTNKKSIRNNRWTSAFLKQYGKENKFKNIFSLISIVFSFISIFLAIGFSNGSTLSQNNALKNNYSIYYATISNKSYYEINNSPLSFSKDVRPSISQLDDLSKKHNYLTFLPNLNYAFSQVPNAKFLNQSLDGFLLVPLLDNFHFSFLEEVIINEEMCALLSLTKEEAISQKIKISNYCSFTFITNDKNNPFIKDGVNIELNLVIKEVVSEFSFLNNPKIYYSYSLLKEYLQGYILNNISKYQQKYVNVYDYIENAKDDEQISSYSMNVFLNDINYADEFFSLIKELDESKENNLSIESNAYQIKDAYVNFMNSFSSALFIFVLIAYAGVNFIIAILSLSTFIEKKKEAAILTCLGARNSSIISIYIKQNFMLLFISFCFALIFINPLQLLLNKLIANQFHLDNLINVPLSSFLGYPFLLPIALFLIALLISTLFVLTPILFYRHISLTDELKEE